MRRSKRWLLPGSAAFGNWCPAVARRAMWWECSAQLVPGEAAKYAPGMAAARVRCPCLALPTKLMSLWSSAERDDVALRCRPVICGSAEGPLPAHHRGTRRESIHGGSYAASMPRKVPRRWAGKDRSRWSVCRVFDRQPTHALVQCSRRFRDHWRHGCRQGVFRIRFTAWPAGGEDVAPSTDQAFVCIAQGAAHETPVLTACQRSLRFAGRFQ
ncbi:hypothetical protein FHY11_000090 [Xanthomonas arboricola]|nr:hypothetical protein [Xanthomonas euroxanthea]